MAEPNPSNVAPWYLRDVAMALQLDETSGNVFMRTGIQGNVYITGPVYVPSGVTITGGNSNAYITGGNSNAYITGGNSNVRILGNVPVTQATNPWIITGNANITGGNSNVVVTGNITGISTLPPITGTVNANITGGNSNVVVTGNITGITALPPITGTVNANITGGNSNVAVTGNIVGITALPPVTISGTVNANIIGGNSNVTVTSMPAVTQGTVPWVVRGNVNVTGGNSNVAIGGTNLDAFGRLRVSNPYTLFDSSLSGERRYDFSSQTTNGGTVTYDYNANARLLNVTTAANSSVIRESMLTFPYQPGKSLLIMNSVKFAPGVSGLTQRAGFFGANNGVYFQMQSTLPAFVIRSSSTGVLDEDIIAQGKWSVDNLDGTGPSGIILDPTATQLIWFDIEWLGVGSIRAGFVIDGQFIVCHVFNHANIAAYTTTYMGSAVLPVRFEIAASGSLPAPATMQQICSTVISEGGYNASSFTFTAGTGITTVRLSSQNTYYPIASIRLNSGYLDAIVKISQVDVLSPTVNYYRWVILKNATLTGATWAAPQLSAKVDVDTAATAITGGLEIQSGYASSRENVIVGEADIYSQLGRTLAGVSDTFTLALAATNNNADVCAQLGYQVIV